MWIVLSWRERSVLSFGLGFIGTWGRTSKRFEPESAIPPVVYKKSPVLAIVWPKRAAGGEPRMTADRSNQVMVVGEKLKRSLRYPASRSGAAAWHHIITSLQREIFPDTMLHS